jgi:hypothetical protein
MKHARLKNYDGNSEEEVRRGRHRDVGSIGTPMPPRMPDNELRE